MMTRREGKLTFKWYPEDSAGGFSIEGLSYIPDRGSPNPTVSLTTFGTLNFHDFSREQLAALADVAREAVKQASSEPEQQQDEE